jgi:elongation factor G
MRREYGVDVNVGRPQVAYRETVRAGAEVDGKVERQAGGRGQFAHVRLRLEPLLRSRKESASHEFVVAAAANEIPREYLPAIEAGIRQQMQSGVLAGYPVIDVRATLVGGSFHPIDSSPVAFAVAAASATRAGVLAGSPALLEPVMKVEVVTPSDHMGDVVGDLNRRRAVSEGIDDGPTGKVVRAHVPMAEMFGYATDLRSATRGRATYTMEFARYQAVPDGIARSIVRRAP